MIIENCIEFDTEFNGQSMNELESHPDYGAGCGMQDTAKDCQLLCFKTPNCHLFTYDVTQKYCWLKKHDITGRSFALGKISGSRSCGYRIGPNTERLGHGIISEQCFRI